MITMNGKPTDYELLEPASPVEVIPDPGIRVGWAWVVIVVLVVLVILWVVGRKTPVGGGGVARRNAALAESKEALGRVVTKDARDAAVQCSLILRNYLSVTFDDPALYETHEEFVLRHDALQALAPELRADAVAGFSRLAALKYGPEISLADPLGVIEESRILLESLHRGIVA